MTTKPPRSDLDNARLQGIACALGELAGSHGEPDLAMMVLDSLGLTKTDLEKAGADDFDLDRLYSVANKARKSA